MDDLATLTLSNTSSKMRSLPTLPNSIYKITEGPKSEVQTVMDFAHMFTDVYCILGRNRVACMRFATIV